MPTVDSSASFATFVYPFLFDAESFEQRVQAVEAATWSGARPASAQPTVPAPPESAVPASGKPAVPAPPEATVLASAEPAAANTLVVWKRQRFPEGAMLPHVAAYLNPREAPGSGPATDGRSPIIPTAYLFEVENNTMASPAGLGVKAAWALAFRREAPVSFAFEQIQLLLFRVGVGLLTVRTRPWTDSLAEWLRFTHYFRYMHNRADAWLVAQLNSGKDQTSPFFPRVAGGLPQEPGGLPGQMDGRRTFGDILSPLLCTGNLPSDPAGTPWWRDVFVPGEMLPFTALFADTPPDEASVPDEVAHLVYRARNFFHIGQGLRPAPEDLRLVDHSALLPYDEGQWFTFSLDGGAFVACDAPRNDFFRKTLPEHLRTSYFLLFLLALHQRFALIGLSDAVAASWLIHEDKGVTREQIEEQREANFTRIRDLLLSFIARGYFTQVMQHEHHHRCYRKWQETFQIEQLYREVKDEVQEMYQYLLLQQTARLKRIEDQQEQDHLEREKQRRHQEKQEEEQRQARQASIDQQSRAEARIANQLTLLGWLIGVPGLLLTWVGAVNPIPWYWAVLVLIVSVLVAALVCRSVVVKKRGHRLLGRVSRYLVGEPKPT